MDIITTIETIIKSPNVECYNIGITIDAKRRRSQYKSSSPMWKYFVILETNLSVKRALSFEKNLYSEIQDNKRSILFKKYRGDTKYGVYTPSLGGKHINNESKYDLYIAWGNKGDN